MLQKVWSPPIWLKKKLLFPLILSWWQPSELTYFSRFHSRTWKSPLVLSHVLLEECLFLALWLSSVVSCWCNLSLFQVTLDSVGYMLKNVRWAFPQAILCMPVSLSITTLPGHPSQFKTLLKRRIKMRGRLHLQSIDSHSERQMDL